MERRFGFFLWAFFLTCTFISVGFMPVPVLCASDSSGAVFSRTALGAGESFSIRYIHSVARRPVVELFTAERGGSLFLRETVFDSFGAGLPFEPLGGERFMVEKGRFRILGMRRSFREVSVRVGREAEHALAVRKRTAALREWERPGNPVLLRVEEVPVLSIALQEVLE